MTGGGETFQKIFGAITPGVAHCWFFRREDRVGGMYLSSSAPKDHSSKCNDLKAPAITVNTKTHKMDFFCAFSLFLCSL